MQLSDIKSWYLGFMAQSFAARMSSFISICKLFALCQEHHLFPVSQSLRSIFSGRVCSGICRDLNYKVQCGRESGFKRLVKNWWRLYESPQIPNVARHIKNNFANSPGCVKCRRKDICQIFFVFYIINVVISLSSSVQSFRNIPVFWT